MAGKPQLAAIPQSLKQACDAPVELPDRALSTADTVKLWGGDRAALGECAVRHSALAKATEALEGQGR